MKASFGVECGLCSCGEMVFIPDEWTHLDHAHIYLNLLTGTDEQKQAATAMSEFFQEHVEHGADTRSCELDDA